MREDLFMAGLGGQGVLLAGQIVAQTAMRAGLEVSWFPAYSPEVRGGETTCTVVIGDGPVGSPIVGNPHVLVLMDAASVANHLPRAAEGALVVVNSSMAGEVAAPEGMTVVAVPANELAIAAGNERTVNLVMVGALLAHRSFVTVDQLADAIVEALPAHRRHLAQVNIDALRAGYAAAAGAARPAG